MNPKPLCFGHPHIFLAVGVSRPHCAFHPIRLLFVTTPKTKLGMWPFSPVCCLAAPGDGCVRSIGGDTYSCTAVCPSHSLKPGGGLCRTESLSFRRKLELNNGPMVCSVQIFSGTIDDIYSSSENDDPLLLVAKTTREVGINFPQTDPIIENGGALTKCGLGKTRDTNQTVPQV